MTHRYLQPVTVTLTAGRLTAFSWRGVHYAVAEVLASWHLRDRWWEPASGEGGAHASDRQYSRVRTADHQVFDLYVERGNGQWILDSVYD
jgi:hypothetical protein